MSSMAAAEGRTCEGSSPKTHAVSMQSVGRTRLPPASIEYLMASSSSSSRGSAVKRSPCRYSSKERRCCSQRTRLCVPLASLDIPYLTVRSALGATQDPAHERGRFIAGETLGELHRLVDSDVGGYVVHMEHLVERKAQDRTVHSAHPADGPTDRDLGEHRVEFLPLLFDPLGEPDGVLLQISPVSPPAL